MNYIARLKMEAVNRDMAIETAQNEITEFMAFLNSPKFTGVESDGGRKDWIATGDVMARLMELRSTLQGVR